MSISFWKKEKGSTDLDSFCLCLCKGHRVSLRWWATSPFLETVESIHLCTWEGPIQFLLSIFFSTTKKPVTTPAWEHAKLPQMCPTVWYPIDCSLPGSSVHGFSRPRYWRGLPCPPPGDLPEPGTETRSLVSPERAGRFLPTSATWEAQSPLPPVVSSRQV